MITKSGDTETEEVDLAERYGKILECKSCGVRKYEDDMLNKRICLYCANEEGISLCDSCGDEVSFSEIVERREVAGTGRIMVYRYCHPCAREGRL